MNIRKEEIDMINIQLTVNIILCMVFAGSFLVNYNNKLKLLNHPTFWSDKERFNVAVTLRWIVIFTAIASSYTAFKNHGIIKQKTPFNQRDLSIANVEVIVTVVAIIVAIANLNIVSTRGRNEIEFEEIVY